jgi:predicted ester cyclase
MTPVAQGLDSVSARTLEVIQEMERALARNADNMGDYFHADFRWMGNFGCGTKESLRAFRERWQLPLRAAFTERSYHTTRFVTQGHWASGFGHIDATHSGVFMGIAPTGQKVRIAYMDFWELKNDKILNNWVSVDFPSVLHQLGTDVFQGRGWEHEHHVLADHSLV